MKQEIDINIAALKAYDAQDYPTALQTFSVYLSSPSSVFERC